MPCLADLHDDFAEGSMPAEALEGFADLRGRRDRVNHGLDAVLVSKRDPDPPMRDEVRQISPRWQLGCPEMGEWEG
jgi:hypothetical protein